MFYIFIFFFTLFAIYIARFVAPFLKLVDLPNKRKTHEGAIPLVGGPIIIISILISNFYFNYDDLISLIIFSTIIIFLFGFFDDIFTIGIVPRLISQFLAVLILVGSGFIIFDFGEYQYLNISLGKASIVFTAFAIAGLTNSINFIDGLDGLCASIFITSIVSLIFLFLLQDAKFNDIEILINLVVIVFAFLLLNLKLFQSCKVFLGDSGSLSLGFILSSLLIYYTQFSNIKLDPVVILWCVTLPVYDLLAVTTKRILNKTNPFKPDRTHIHHLILKRGHSNKTTLLILVLISLFLNFFGFGLFYFFGPDLSLFLYFFIFFLYFVINYKKYI